MGWQLIFKAPDTDSEQAAGLDTDRPALPRKPVSMKVQLDPGTMVVVTGGDDDDDD